MGTSAGDIDGDGRTDLVLATYAGIDVYLQHNGGLVRTGLIEVAQLEQISLVDFDGDGDLDLVVEGLIGVHTLAGTGAGTFGSPTRAALDFYTEIETGDVTGDGLVDIVGVGAPSWT